MPSEFFERIISILKDTPLKDDAEMIVEKCCSLLDKTPDQLEPGDGGILITQLMSDTSNLLSPKEWAALDARFKTLLEEGGVRKKGKVKGVILSSILEYISFKKGIVSAEGMKQNLRLPGTFRPLSWYPIEVLETILEKVEIMMGQSKKPRCRDMGYYIMSHAEFTSARYLFGNGGQIKTSFSNLKGIIMLTKFKVRSEGDEIVVKFDGNTSGNLHNFLMGLCDGIFKLKNIRAISAQMFIEEGGVAAIYLGFTHK